MREKNMLLFMEIKIQHNLVSRICKYMVIFSEARQDIRPPPPINVEQIFEGNRALKH